ncbi:hypothetical protein ACHAXA_009578 [Cyclostephanos tholiformis]|uniref:Uncharacterized protein n=1 Tax=Cyclostephanos tholiformis TaxID=382380 RepID=A0ABD3SDR3_9STRA
MNEPTATHWKRIAPMRRAVQEAERRAERDGLESPADDGEGYYRGREGGGNRQSTQDGATGGGRASHHLPTRHRSFINGTRAPMILSLLLLVTLIVQVLLMAHHDDIVVNQSNNVRRIGVKQDENDDAIGYNADDDGLNKDQGERPLQEEGGQKIYSNYSMDPVDILKRAGIDHTAGFIPSITGREARLAKKLNRVDSLVKKAELPTLGEIQSMYGSHPYIVGLERCEEYREAVKPENRLMGPAGLFNSATNLLQSLLSLNCVNTARQRVARQRNWKVGRTGITNTAPWGKHNPVSWRNHHETKFMHGIAHADFLPIVMIKDPITWMASMCRHQYETRWVHRDGHCPNLVPNKYDRRRKPGVGTIELNVKFATKHIGDEPMPDNKNKTFVHYTSLVDMWNVWYRDWHNVSFPRLMVRFEDLLFHAEYVVSQVCACGGGTMTRDFRYVEGSAKGQGGPHAGSAGFLASLVTYGNSTLRMTGILTDKNDVEYARMHLDKGLLDLFGYAPI